MKDVNKIVDVVIKAIDESGKSFNQLSQSVVLNYLAQIGVNDSVVRDRVYRILKEHYTSKKTEIKKDVKVEVKNPVDKVPEKGRKSIFGEIKRIA
jgi:hypothetical protein